MNKVIHISKQDSLKPNQEKVIPVVGKFYTIAEDSWAMRPDLEGTYVRVVDVHIVDSGNLLVEATVKTGNGEHLIAPTNVVQGFFSHTPPITVEKKEEKKKYKVTTTVVEEL